MNRILILAVILTATTAFGQSAVEPEHAPTAAQCDADVRLWARELVDKIKSDNQPQHIDFSTEADQTNLGEWMKRWSEMDTCVHLQYGPTSDRSAVTESAIESRVFFERFVVYITSDSVRGEAYKKWEIAEQAKARQKMAEAKSGR